MNRQVPNPYVVTAAGGKKGGGTLLTEEGERAIALFWEFMKSSKNSFQARIWQ